MGAEQLYKAYASSGLSKDEFEGPRYQRIGHIRKLMAEGLLGTDLRVREEQPQHGSVAATA